MSNPAGTSALEVAIRKFDVRNPLGYISEQADVNRRAAQARPASNAMLLHPFMPVHVRYALLGIGLGGAYVYLSQAGYIPDLEATWKRAALPDHRQTASPDSAKLKLPEPGDFPTLGKLPSPPAQQQVPVDAPIKPDARSGQQEIVTLAPAAPDPQHPEPSKEELAAITQLFQDALAPPNAGSDASTAAFPPAPGNAAAGAAAPSKEGSKEGNSSSKAATPTVQPPALTHAAVDRNANVVGELATARDSLLALRDSEASVDSNGGKPPSLAGDRTSAEKWAERARAYLAMAEETVERMSTLLEQQRESSKAVLADALATQELELQVAHTDERLRERITRHEVIDNVRMRVNALSRALDAQSDELKASQDAHQLAATVSGLSEALARGSALGADIERVRGLSRDDPLVAAVLASLPPSVLGQGTASRQELQERWPAVKRAVTVQSILPNGGGLLSTAFASLAARLKFSERDTSDVGVPATSLDSKLAQVESRLLEGRLAEAAADLEELAQKTPTAGPVQEWVAAARARVLSEQAVSLLQAHASVMHVSALH